MTHMPDAGFPVDMVGGVPVVKAPEEIDITNAGQFREALSISAARGASCAQDQRLAASYPAPPKPSRGDRSPGASSQRRARLCPGAGERPPSGSSASRGE